MTRCLDCAAFTGDGVRDGLCGYDPIPRRGTCGRCDAEFVPREAALPLEPGEEQPA